MLQALHYDVKKSRYAISAQNDNKSLIKINFTQLPKNTNFFVTEISGYSMTEDFWESTKNDALEYIRTNIQRNVLNRFVNFLYKLTSRDEAKNFFRGVFKTGDAINNVMGIEYKDTDENELVSIQVSNAIKSSVFSNVETFIKCLPIMDLTKLWDSIHITCISNTGGYSININPIGSDRVTPQFLINVEPIPAKSTLSFDSDNLCNLQFTFSKLKTFGNVNTRYVLKGLLAKTQTSLNWEAFNKYNGRASDSNVSFELKLEKYFNTVREILNPPLNRKEEVFAYKDSIPLYEWNNDYGTRFYLKTENFLIALSSKDFPILSKWRKEYVPNSFLHFVRDSECLNTKWDGIKIISCILHYSRRKLELVSSFRLEDSQQITYKKSYKNIKKINKFLEKVIEPELKNLCNKSTTTFRDFLIGEYERFRNAEYRTNLTPLDNLFDYSATSSPVIKVSFDTLQEICFTSAKSLFKTFVNTINNLYNSVFYFNENNQLECSLLEPLQNNCLYIPRVGFLNEFFRDHIKSSNKFPTVGDFVNENLNMDLATICLYKHLYYIYICLAMFNGKRTFYVTSHVSKAQEHQRNTNTYNIYLISRMKQNGKTFKTFKTLSGLYGFKVVII